MNSAQRNLYQFLHKNVDDILFLSKLAEHLSKFYDYFKTCHPNMSFAFEQEKNGKFSFLSIDVSQEKEKFVTTVYRIGSLLLVVCTLIFKVFCQQYMANLIWFILWLLVVSNFVLIGQSFFQKKGYPLSFTDTCFKTIVDVVHKMSSVNNSWEENLIFVITIPWRNSIIYKLELS